MAKGAVPPYFTETQCRIMNFQENTLNEISDNVTTGWELVIRKDPFFIILPNLRYINTNDYPGVPFKYFLTDSHDLDLIEKIEKGQRGKKNLGEALKNLTSFSKFGKKNLYIRSIPSETYGQSDECRLFVDDVVEVITIMINRGAAKNRKMAERKLHVYKKDWAKQQTETTLATITVEELVDILGIMDIDRSILSIVEDPIYYSTKKDMYEFFGYIRTCSPNCVPVVDKGQAIFMVFHSCVNGINWNKEECFRHTKCRELLKSEILRAMRKLAGLETGTYTYVYHILAIIEEIRVYCPIRYKGKRVVLDYAFTGHYANDQLDVNHIKNVLDAYGLEPVTGCTMDVRVTAQRFFIQLFWINQFFTDPKDEKLRDMVCNAITFLAHEDRYDFCKSNIARTFKGRMSRDSPFRISDSFPDEPKPPGIVSYTGPPGLSNGVSISLPKPFNAQNADPSSDSSEDIHEARDYESEKTELENANRKDICMNCDERLRRIKKVRVATGVLRKKMAILQEKVLSEEEIEEKAKENDIKVDELNQKLLIKEEMIEERRFQGKSKETLMEANSTLIQKIAECKSTHATLTVQKKEAIEKKDELEKENSALTKRIEILQKQLAARKLTRGNSDSGGDSETSDSKISVLKDSKKTSALNAEAIME